jgi:hypothetical protein
MSHNVITLTPMMKLIDSLSRRSVTSSWSTSSAIIPGYWIQERLLTYGHGRRHHVDALA